MRHRDKRNRREARRPPKFSRHKAEPHDRLIPIAGRRPVEELLHKGIIPDKLLATIRDRRSKPDELLERLRAAGWKIEERTQNELDEACEGLHHQGFVAFISNFPFRSLHELINLGENRPVQPLIIALDQIQDAGNLGAILRTAECAGAAGAIIPQHRAAGITAAVIRASAGAALHLPLCRVVNLSGALDGLRVAGYHIVGADQEGDRSLYNTKLDGKLALVVGSEGRGLRPGIKRRCDDLVSIPLAGRVSSLNASVAAALFLYEAARQRMTR